MPRRLQPGVALAAVGMLLAITSAWGRPAGDWDGLVLPAAVPGVVALTATATEALHANGHVFDTSAISLLLVPVSFAATFVGARRAGRRWRSGLWAWSLVLFHLGVSVGALAGIPLGTFGSETRSDELLVWGGALVVLTILAITTVAVGSLPGRGAAGGVG